MNITALCGTQSTVLVCFNPVHKVRSVQHDRCDAGDHRYVGFNPVHKVRSVQP